MLNCSVSNQILRNGDSSPGLTLKCTCSYIDFAFFKGVVTWSCESFNSLQGKQQAMLAHEPSFNTMVSEILGFLDFLPFSLPWLTASLTICCIVVVSG